MKFWQQLLNKLQENQTVYLLTVIQNAGSSPGRKGFKMLVAKDGFIFGSIGGGVMEFALVEEAKKLLQKEKQPILYKEQVHRKNSKDSSGMMCSGTQTVVFHPLHKTAVFLIQGIVDCLQNNQRKTISFSPTGIEFIENIFTNKYEASIQSETDWQFKELIGFKETIYIIGGGHVGLAVSQLFKQLNFDVVVFDNRENLNTLNENIFTNQKHVIEYGDIANYIREGNESYVAIMTNKCSDDKLALSKLIKKPFKFLGVLGSKSKLKNMWNAMRKEGFTQQELDAVYAPIGLHIKSQTPEEIAVSIAAQIIQVKNK